VPEVADVTLSQGAPDATVQGQLPEDAVRLTLPVFAAAE